MKQAQKQPRGVHRVRLGFHAVAPDPIELADAVKLATLFDAELAGLLLENLDLMEFAQQPFAGEVLPLGGTRPLDPDVLARGFRILAQTTSRMLEQAASQSNRPWRFDVKRGQTITDLWQDLGDHEIMMLGRAQSLDLMVHRTAKPEGAASVAVAYTGSESCVKALDLGIHLAEYNQLELVVLLHSHDEGGRSRLQKEVSSHLEGSRLNVRYHHMDHWDRLAMLSALRQEGAAQLVIGLDDHDEQLRALSERIPCQLILVR